MRKENTGMKVSEFNYNLPEELIAQQPTIKRDLSRLMVLDKKNQTIEHRSFKDIVDYLQEQVVGELQEFYPMEEKEETHGTQSAMTDFREYIHYGIS